MTNPNKTKSNDKLMKQLKKVIKLIELMDNNVSRNFTAVGNQLKLSEIVSKHYQGACDTIIQNQTRIEAKLDLLLGDKAPPKSSSPVDFIHQTLVPDSKDLSGIELGNKNSEEQKPDGDITVMKMFLELMSATAVSKSVPDFIPETRGGNLRLCINSDGTKISNFEAGRRIYEWVHTEESNGFAQRYGHLPVTSMIELLCNYKVVTVKRLTDYVTCQDDDATVIEFLTLDKLLSAVLNVDDTQRFKVLELRAVDPEKIIFEVTRPNERPHVSKFEMMKTFLHCIGQVEQTSDNPGNKKICLALPTSVDNSMIKEVDYIGITDVSDLFYN